MIAIVDYGVGNLFSVEKAFLKFSPDVVLTSDAKGNFPLIPIGRRINHIFYFSSSIIVYFNTSFR